MPQQIVDLLVSIAALVAILDYFGIKPEKPVWGLAMPLSRNWKLWIMLLLVVTSFGMSGYSFYQSLQKPIPASVGTSKEITEFDDKSKELVLGYGMDGSDSCFENVNGSVLLSRQAGYKLAVACLFYDGKEDFLDAPYLQVSNLYDIRDGTVAMKATFKPYFLTYLLQMHASGIHVVLLNVPNGVDVSQFKTLRQARAVGVKIPASNEAGVTVTTTTTPLAPPPAP